MPSIQELMPKREVLECQLRAEPQGFRHQGKQPQNHQDHGCEVSSPEARKVNRFSTVEILARDSSPSLACCEPGSLMHREGRRSSNE